MSSGEAVTSKTVIERVHKSYDSVSIVVVRRAGRNTSYNEGQINSIVKAPGFYAKASGKNLDDDLNAVTGRFYPKEKQQPEIGC